MPLALGGGILTRSSLPRVSCTAATARGTRSRATARSAFFGFTGVLVFFCVLAMALVCAKRSVLGAAALLAAVVRVRAQRQHPLDLGDERIRQAGLGHEG